MAFREQHGRMFALYQTELRISTISTHPGDDGFDEKCCSICGPYPCHKGFISLPHPGGEERHDSAHQIATGCAA